MSDSLGGDTADAARERPGGEPLLAVRDLQTRFETAEGTVRAVDGASFSVGAGETVCLVGESGAGKTVACESITRLIPTPPGEVAGGEVVFDGTDLTDLSEGELTDYRGGRIGHVFQNPGDALDPVYTVGQQVVEAIRLHRDVTKATARKRAVELLDRVGIGDAMERFDDYPHQFSGGMKQRVVIAMALAPDPDLLIADEPTTALDVTIQKQVLGLLDELTEEREMALLFVTHDLGVVAEIADRVVVMYAGKVMERGDVFSVFESPAHPYTRALLECLPGRGTGFETIGGSLPDPTDPPGGCRFHPCCPHAVRDCEAGDQPEFQAVDHDAPGGPGGPDGETGEGHETACLLYGPGYDRPPALADPVGAGGDGQEGGTAAPDDNPGPDGSGADDGDGPGGEGETGESGSGDPWIGIPGGDADDGGNDADDEDGSPGGPEDPGERAGDRGEGDG